MNRLRYAGAGLAGMLLGFQPSVMACETGWSVTLLGPVQLSSPGASARVSNTGGFAIGEQFLWQCGFVAHTFAGETGGVNSVGHAAGWIGGSSGQAFFWDGTTMTMLGPGYAFGLNDKDDVVGQLNSRATMWINGVAWNLTPTSFPSDAFDVSNSGFAVGSHFPDGNNRRAFRWFQGTLTNLGTLPGGTLSIAFGVNDAGVAVGYSDQGNGYTAFAHSGTTMTPLPPLNDIQYNVAFGINGSGDIVGYSTAGGAGPYHAVLWQRGEPIDLQTRVWSPPGITLQTAYDISDDGWIVGWATTNTGSWAYLMRPAHVADVNCDGPVDVDDLLLVIAGWGVCGWFCPADIDANEQVNVDDLLAVINGWGACQ